MTRSVREWNAAGTLGGTLPADYSPEAYPHQARALIVVSFAGAEAEIRATGRVDLAGSRSDLEDAFETADALANDGALALLRECQAEARRIVGDRWAAIEAIAAALIENANPWLNEDELRWLVL